MNITVIAFTESKKFYYTSSILIHILSLFDTAQYCLDEMSNKVYPDQTASSEAVWSGYTIFAHSYVQIFRLNMVLLVGLMLNVTVNS